MLSKTNSCHLTGVWRTGIEVDGCLVLNLMIFLLYDAAFIYLVKWKSVVTGY